MIYSDREAIPLDHFPDRLIIDETPFSLIYTFKPGDELDGIALVCPSNELALLSLPLSIGLFPAGFPKSGTPTKNATQTHSLQPSSTRHLRGCAFFNAPPNSPNTSPPPLLTISNKPTNSLSILMTSTPIPFPHFST